MNCSEFERRLGLEDGPEAEEALRAHAARCEGCARKLRLRDLLAGGLGRLPRTAAPAPLDEVVRGAAREVLEAPRKGFGESLALLAAVLAVVAAGGVILGLLAPGARTRRHDLRVVVEAGNGFVEEESVLEEIYGPDASPLLTAQEDFRRGR